MVLGFVAAAALGGGGGAAIGPVAQGMAPTRFADTARPTVDHTQVSVEGLEGHAEVLNAYGEWRPVVAGDVLHRPLTVRTLGPDARLSLFFKGVRLVALRDSQLRVSAPGAAPAITVVDGNVLALRTTGEMTAYAPAQQVKVTGQAFGIWVRGEDVAVSVLDGELELLPPNNKPIKFARGREIVVADRVSPVALEQALEIQVQGTSRRGARTTLTGRVPIHAQVFRADERGQTEPVPVSAAGVFSVDLADKQPAPGELVAYDSAGRRAEVDSPSESLDVVLAALTKGASLPARAPARPAAEAQKPAAEAPRPAAAAPQPVAETPKPVAETPKPAVEAPTPKPALGTTRGGAPPESVKIDVQSPRVTGTTLDKPKVGPPARPKPEAAPKPKVDEPAKDDAL